MTRLESGHIETTNKTPTGARKLIAVDNSYLTKDEFIATSEATNLGVNSASTIYTSGELEKIILRASGWVNRYCMQYFDTQTIDETETRFKVRPYNPRLVTVILKNAPYAKINSIYIQVLQWFIQITFEYLQDFNEFGYYKIVPMLSSAGMGGIGLPVPSQIINTMPLGVLWTNYTFGYGTPLTDQTLTSEPNFKSYQAPIGNQLWAPSQTTNVYKNGVLITTGFNIDYVNGKVTFTSANIISDVITADFTSNESIPSDIQQAVISLVSYIISDPAANIAGATSYNIQTYGITFPEENIVYKKVKMLLDPYKRDWPRIL